MKIYLTLIWGILIASIGYSQTTYLLQEEPLPVNSIKDQPPFINPPSQLKSGNAGLTFLATGDTIWYEDFSGGIPSGWSIDNQSGICPWVYSTDGSWGYFNGNNGTSGAAAMLSTTASNGFLICDPDSANNAAYGQPSGSTYQYLDSYFTTDAIDLSGYSSVLLEFQQSFRKNNDIDLVVSISSDNSNWTDFTVQGNVANNTASPDPDQISINISAVAANQPTVYIKMGWSARVYFWMVDDIVVKVGPDNDLKITEVYYDQWFDTLGNVLNLADSQSTLYYTQTPLRQAQADEIYFGAEINNNGGANQTNVTLTARAHDGTNYAYQKSHSIAGIVSGATDTVIVPAAFSPVAKGTYAIEFESSADATDENPNNNIWQDNIIVGDSIYARDNEDLANAGFWWYGAAQPFEVGNMIEIFTQDTATSISYYNYTNTGSGIGVVGNVISLNLYDGTGFGNFTPLASYSFYSIASADENAWITLSIPETPLPPGGYVVTMESYSDQCYASSQAAPPLTGYIDTDNGNSTWYYTSRIPWVRLNTKPSAQPCTMSATGTTTSLSCFGDNSGSAIITPSGGTGPYNYLWDDVTNNTTDSIGGLAGGFYTVTVTDASGCLYQMAFDVVEPGVISITTEQSDASCNGGSDGAASVTVIGGTAPFTYSWSDSTLAGANPSGIAAGTYTVTVDDANGCPSSIGTIVINEPSALTVSFSETTATCGIGGTATVTVTGGSSPYMYSWDDPGMQTTATATGLGSGLYTATVTDNNGCVATMTDSVSGTDPVTFTSSANSPSSCGVADGSATVTVTTGTSPFAYNWSDGQATSTASGLAAGSYTVTVIDFVGCTHTETVNIVDVGAPALSITASNQVSCMGGSDGDATVTAFSPGTPPYNYNWSNGQTTAQATGLVAGTYTVTVTGSDSCSALISTTITEPATAVTIDSLVISDVSCNGAADGAASVYASGGTVAGNHTYNWSNGQTSNNASGLSGGAFGITVTDDNGCTASDSIAVNEAVALSTSVATTNISCNGDDDGTLDLTVTGGTAPFTYNWTPGGNSTEDVTGLSQGTYSVQVTDANGCIANTGSSITEPQALSVSSGTVTPPSSTGGSDGAIDMNVTGGTAPYTYLWNNGATTEDLTNIGGGVSYTLSVTDANGCGATEVVFVNDGPVNIAENYSNNQIQIFPNPNNGQFEIYANLKANSDGYLEIRNSIGQLIWKESVIPSMYYYKKIRLGNQPPGIYFITLGTIEEIVIAKVVIY